MHSYKIYYDGDRSTRTIFHTNKYEEKTFLDMLQTIAKDYRDKLTTYTLCLFMCQKYGFVMIDSEFTVTLQDVYSYKYL